MGRPPDFDLSRAIAAAGFTPSQRDLPALLELVASPDEAIAAHAARALTRLPPAAVIAALARGDGDEARAMRRVTALGQVARAHPAAGGDAALAAILADVTAPPRARRAAAVALGKVGGDVARDALARYWETDLPPDHRRSVAEALGKVGGDAELARLRALDAGGDAELARRRDRAVLMIERGAARGDESLVDDAAAPPFPVALIARCRAGLEELLAGELAALGLGPRIAAPGVVELRLQQPLATVWRARTLLGAGIALPLPAAARGAEGAELAEAIAAVLSEARTVALLGALTRGPVRWRLDFATGGHRRAVVWETARRVAARRPELINDPTATTWDVVVDEAAGRLELRPRRIADPRFAWRVRDVPAASHPTVAAALARIAGRRDDDVVWDPFCGSGAELIERALLGPFARLIGSDREPRALDAARANLEAAGLVDRAELVAADALTHRPAGVTLIVTNPPLGRRLRGDAPTLLEAFLAHAGSVLAPGGRLVWISPVPKRTERAARRAGLVADGGLTVDLGGFDGRIERWLRR